MLRFIVAGLLLVSANLHAEEFLVKNRAGFFTTFNQFSAVQVMDAHSPGRLTKVDIRDPKNLPIILAQIWNDPSVEYIVPNFKLHRLDAPVELLELKEQWAIKMVNAEAAWTRAENKGSEDILVAVIDTGVDGDHESLMDNLVPGYDFADNDNDPDDKTSFQNPGHGTHCSGIVGATGDIDGGIVGAAPGIRMMALRFLDERGSGDLMNGIKAIDYAIENGADVISASWGAAVSAETAKPLTEAVKRASDANVIFVAAAANDGKNNDKVSMFPANANFANTITVAASNSADAKPSWSNYGKGRVHIAAPGDSIMSSLPGDKYGNLSGTSMATPMISGVVAFLLSQNPELTGAQIKAIMQTTGAKVEIETACDCRVDMDAAVKAVLEQEKVLVPTAITFEKGEKGQFEMLNAEGAVTFASSNTSIATISDTGELLAVAEGDTVITATDSTGDTVQSMEVRVAKYESGGGGGNPPGMGECPFDDDMLCQGMCAILPTLPWCEQ